jgi:hypothetical protein
MAIPQLITLLNKSYGGARVAIVSTLAKLTDHGEFVIACYPGIANAGVKSSFARKLGWPFHSSLCC